MSEHMIQSAMLAEKAKCNDDLICACLLHDYGHFLSEDPEELVKNKLDGEHENIGYQYLKKFFGQKIVEPITYQVLAKRYLARKKKYYDFLSDAAKISLKLQGGVLNEKEAKEFENNEFFESSVKLRKFDEGAKKFGLKIKSIKDYKKLLISKLL